MTPSGVKSSSRVWQLQCLCWVFQEHGSEISCSLQESRQTSLKQFDFLQRFSRSIDLWPSLFLLTTELQRFLIWLENITYCALFKWSLVSQVSSFLHTALGFHYYISYQPIICKWVILTVKPIIYNISITLTERQWSSEGIWKYFLKIACQHLRERRRGGKIEEMRTEGKKVLSNKRQKKQEVDGWGRAMIKKKNNRY